MLMLFLGTDVSLCNMEIYVQYLFLEELCDPVHLLAERVDHPHVLLTEAANRNVLGKALKSVKKRIDISSLFWSTCN